MRGADILVEMLIGYGVEVILGVPGDTNVPLYEALQQREGEIRHVMARDERWQVIWPMPTVVSPASRGYLNARRVPARCILSHRWRNPIPPPYPSSS